MTYLHFDGQDNVMISSSKLVNDPNELVDFLVGSILSQFSSSDSSTDHGGSNTRASELNRIEEEDDEEEEEEEDNNANLVHSSSSSPSSSSKSIHISALTAYKRALFVIKRTSKLLESRIEELTHEKMLKKCNISNTGTTSNENENSYQQQYTGTTSSSSTGIAISSNKYLSTPEIRNRYEKMTSIQPSSHDNMDNMDNTGNISRSMDNNRSYHGMNDDSNNNSHEMSSLL